MATVTDTTATEAGVAHEHRDPWAELLQENPGSDGWLLSYVDVLTLMLVLMVVLLMLQHQGKSDETVELVAENPVEIELPPQPQVVELVQQEPEPEQKTEPLPEPKPIHNIEPLLPTENFELVSESKESGSLIHSVLAMAAEFPPATGPQVAEKETKPALKQEEPVKPAAPDPRPFIKMLRWKGLGDGVTLSTTATQLRLETKDNILFTDASAELSDGGEELLGDLAGVLVKQPGTISVEGHADSRPIVSGAYLSNWELSAARAAGVVRFLVEQGVAAERLRAIGYSDTQPRADNDSSEGRAANRRVSLVLELQPDTQSALASQQPLM